MKSSDGAARSAWASAALLLMATALWLSVGSAAVGIAGGPASVEERGRVQAAALALDPGAVILQPDEVNWAACGMRPRDPVVRGDFNGDGRADYVALLRLGEPREARVGNGPVYAGVDVWLVAFLGEAGGAFRRITLDEHPASPLPIDVAIDLQPAGLVRAVEDRRQDVMLRNPGIRVLYCEKAGKVVYWHAKSRRFRDVWTVD